MTWPCKPSWNLDPGKTGVKHHMVDCLALARKVGTCGTGTTEHKQEARIKTVMEMWTFSFEKKHIINCMNLEFWVLVAQNRLHWRQKSMYPSGTYLDGNQIGALPAGVFTYNTELTRP